MVVVAEGYICSIPANLDLAAATPLLCAGITMYSPMIHYGLQPSQRFAVVGLGGLGHMGAKLGVAFGAHTTVISRGSGKRESALGELKVHAYLDSTDVDAMTAAAGSFDFIIDTVSAEHDMGALLRLLDTDGKLILVGAPPTPLSIAAFSLIPRRKTLAGSMIGGIKETQDMLDFCGRHNITCDIEQIDASRINEAYDRTVRSDVKYRFVIDCDTI